MVSPITPEFKSWITVFASSNIGPFPISAYEMSFFWLKCDVRWPFDPQNGRKELWSKNSSDLLKFLIFVESAWEAELSCEDGSFDNQTFIFSESLEDENIKLLEMIRQREKTIKNLEVKTRNALEISIKADDGNLVLVIFKPSNYF